MTSFEQINNEFNNDKQKLNLTHLRFTTFFYYNCNFGGVYKCYLTNICDVKYYGFHYYVANNHLEYLTVGYD